MYILHNTFFSSSHEKVAPILGEKTHFNKFKGVEIKS